MTEYKVYYRVSSHLPTLTHTIEAPSLTPDTFVRFEGLSVHEAERFATDVYRREGIVCNIEEINRHKDEKK